MTLLAVGHWTDAEALTGCTALLPPPGAVCAAEVRGGGPGTRETALFGPGPVRTGADAILLTGGSAFGLAAAVGVHEALAERGVGVATPAGPVPIVPAAVVFDRMLGAAAAPDATAGRAALAAAVENRGPHRGSVGAGTGCTVGKLDGASGWMRGGLGWARVVLAGDAVVEAWAVVNAFGDVLGEDGRPLAGLRRDGELAGSEQALLAGPAPAPFGENTTLAVVATDATLDKTGALRLAAAAHVGIARATSPAATVVDGDVAFAVATGARPGPPLLALETAVAAAVARACRDAVRAAGSVQGCPALEET
jgi:L-aminopeptidase/D-esterase-like protein